MWLLKSDSSGGGKLFPENKNRGMLISLHLHEDEDDDFSFVFCECVCAKEGAMIAVLNTFSNFFSLLWTDVLMADGQFKKKICTKIERGRWEVEEGVS